MRRTGLTVVGFLALIAASVTGWAQGAGEQVYKSTCFACHTIGGGRLVGPDLAGIHEKRSREWLAQFILSSQKLIASGDADAVAVFEEYNGLIMPDSALSDAQVEAVLDYIEAQSGGAETASTDTAGSDAAATPAASTPAEAEAAAPEQIALGQELFQGTVRFAEGGPACNACHDVKNDAVIGGGILARELTSVFTKMGKAGVAAVIGQAPFPVMQAAYEDQELTEEEVSALVAFLQDADEQQFYQQPRDYGLGLFTSGVVGTLVIFGFCGLVWRGRKSESVNQRIYDRQTKSV